MNRDTYIIVPIYNEGNIVGTVLKQLQQYFVNIVCVDDGSNDNSCEVVTNTGAILVQHPINLGAGAATQTGISFALQDKQAKYFITIDADGQHDTKDALKMLSYLRKHDVDIVMGSRFLGRIENISKVKKVFLKLAAGYSKMTSGVALTDPHIGLRAFNRKFAENLKITLPDFAHASELVHRIGEGKYKYAEVPITVTYTDYTKLKGQPMLNAINITFDLLINRMNKK